MQDSVIKSVRRHAKARMGVIKHRYVWYRCTLEEGKPPKNYYYHSRPLQPQEHIQNWLQENRRRQIAVNL